MKEHNHESIRLMANDQLLKSKGFLLFCVDQFGVLTMCGDTTELTPAERWGLESYTHHNTITKVIDEEDE